MSTNKWLKSIIYLGVFVIPFLPLIISTNSYFPFITGKGFAFRVIIEIVLASWLILALRDKNYRPKKSFILYSVLAILVATGLATIFSENPYRSFWSNYERMGGYISLLHLGAYFMVLVSFLRKKSEWFWLINTALVANWFIAIYSFFQLVGKIDIHQGGVRLDATLGNATYLAVYVLFGFFISIYLLSIIKNNGARVFYGLTAVIDLFLLYHTATRGAILGLLVGLIVLAGFLIWRGSVAQKKWAGGAIIAIVVLISGFLLVRNASFVQNSPVLSRFASISPTETTTQSRFLIWNMSLQGFKDHPLLGWGPENYSLVFSKYYDPAMWRQEPWFDRSHNIFLDWLIDAGLIGLLAYLSIFVAVFYYLWRDRNKFGVGAYLFAGLFAAYLFNNIFVFDNLISYLYFFAVLAYLHFAVTENDSTEELKVKTNYQTEKNKKLGWDSNEWTINALVVAVIIILLATLYYFNYKPWKVSRELISALRPGMTSTQSLNIFKEIFAQNTFGSGEAREQLISKTASVLGNSQATNEEKGKFVELTDDQIKIHLAKFNQDTRSYLLFGSFLSSIGESEQGINYLLKAKMLSPKKQQILFELAAAYIRTKNAPGAIMAAREAYDLDPTYAEARKLYAVVLLLTGQNKLASDILAPIKNDPTYYNDQRFVVIYEQNGDIESLARIKDLRETKEKK